MIIELEENSRLSVKLSQDYGEYRVYVRKEFVEKHDGYMTVTSTPFADGNFFVKVAYGRKSKKWLEEGEKFLESVKDYILQKWSIGDYVAVAWMLQGMFVKKDSEGKPMRDENGKPIMMSPSLVWTDITYLQC